MRLTEFKILLKTGNKNKKKYIKPKKNLNNIIQGEKN